MLSFCWTDELLYNHTITENHTGVFCSLKPTLEKKQLSNTEVRMRKSCYVSTVCTDTLDTLYQSVGFNDKHSFPNSRYLGRVWSIGQCLLVSLRSTIVSGPNPQIRCELSTIIYPHRGIIPAIIIASLSWHEPTVSTV